MAQEWQIEGKHYLVTGGASGLGAGNVLALLEEGAKAVAILDINEDGGKALAQLYNKTYPGKVTFITCDISSDDNLTRAFNQVLAKLKRIDVIINNAGIVNDSQDQWVSSVDVNLKGVISLTWKGVNHMRKDTGGSGGAIINVSSIAAFMKLPGIPVYSATKSAVLQFGRCISYGDFYENTGVRIMTIVYGATDTALYQSVEKYPCDEKKGQQLQKLIKDMPRQTVDTAAKGIISMIMSGTNGSIWIAQHGEPVRDVTSVLEDAYDNIGKTLKF